MLSHVERTALILVTLVLLGFIVYVVVKKSRCDAPPEKFSPAAAGGAPSGFEGTVVQPLLAGGADLLSTVEAPSTDSAAPACYPRDRLTAEDLLPKDAANSKWAQMNPAGQGDAAGINYLSAAWQVGVDTQGSSLRNASWDLRSEPPNPQIPVSPFMNTTITPNLLRRPLEIGGDY